MEAAHRFSSERKNARVLFLFSVCLTTEGKIVFMNLWVFEAKLQKFSAGLAMTISRNSVSMNELYQCAQNI